MHSFTAVTLSSPLLLAYLLIPSSLIDFCWFFFNSHLTHVIWCHLSELPLLFIFTLQIFHSLFLLLPVSKHDCCIFTKSSTHLISISDNYIFLPFSSFCSFSCSFCLTFLLAGNIFKGSYYKCAFFWSFSVTRIWTL